MRTSDGADDASGTYISTLVRAHLRQLAPLPDRELVALQSAVVSS